MCHIPKELWPQIISYLDDEELFAMAQVCKSFNVIVTKKRENNPPTHNNLIKYYESRELYNLKCATYAFFANSRVNLYNFPIRPMVERGLITIIEIYLSFLHRKRFSFETIILIAIKYYKMKTFETFYVEYLAEDYPINFLNNAILVDLLWYELDSTFLFIDYIERLFGGKFYFDSFFKKSYNNKLAIMRRFDRDLANMHYLILSRFKRLDILFAYIVNSNNEQRLARFISAMDEFGFTIEDFSKIKVRRMPQIAADFIRRRI